MSKRQPVETFPVSIEAALAEARDLSQRLAFLLDAGLDGPTPLTVVDDVEPHMHASGFDNFNDYSEWLRLEGHRKLALSVRDVGDGQRQMFDGLGEVLQTEAASTRRWVGLLLHRTPTSEQRRFRALGLLRRCVRLIQRLNVGHGLAPSSDVEGSVEASSATHPPVADDKPGGLS